MNIKPKVQWNKMEEGWLRKTITVYGKVPQHTYHYGNKSSKPCKVLEINNRVANHYSGYSLIEIDLKEILEYIDELTKVLKDKEQNTVLKKALVRAIVITYSKCFTTTNGRGVKLEESIISQTNRGAHEELMTMRNEYVAHAGDSLHESSKYCLVLSPQKHYRKKQTLAVLKSVESHQTILTQSFTDTQLIKLVQELDIHVKRKIEKLEKKLILITGRDYSPLYDLGGKKIRVSLDEKTSDLIFNDKPLKF